ncbi:unnamed protein product, partial [Rotaria sp. Silwood2]
MFLYSFGIRRLCIGFINRINNKELFVQNRGIEYLFPVQYSSFNDIINRKDCIVQARTRTGKTLAFSLPIVERLQDDKSNILGRYPRCLVLEPTRELAKQVTNDFLSIKSRSLLITTLYGGKEYSRQELSLKKGSDIVIGTPERIKDFLNKKKVFFNQCQIIVLDEVDRMLDMGFQDDVDYIIKNVYCGKRKCHDYSQQKPAINVQHLSFKLNNIDKRAEIVLSLFEKYSNNINKSQSIVFCQTKQECDLLAKSNEIYSISLDVL